MQFRTIRLAISAMIVFGTSGAALAQSTTTSDTTVRDVSTPFTHDNDEDGGKWACSDCLGWQLGGIEEKELRLRSRHHDSKPPLTV